MTDKTDKTAVTPEERHRMIAETAYFLAHERGFTGGDPVSDWIEAERIVDQQLCELATARMLERLESGVAATTKKLGAVNAWCIDTRGSGAHSNSTLTWKRLDARRLSLRSKIDELRKRGDTIKPASCVSGR